MSNWLLVTGTGRCGTGFTAHVLNSVRKGMCSHEGVFTLKGWQHALELLEKRRAYPNWKLQADSSWLAVPYLQRPELFNMTAVHLVRHPKNTIESIVKEMRWAMTLPRAPFMEYGEEHFPEIKQHEDDIVNHAAAWYITFNREAECRGDIRHKVEDGPQVMLDRLGIDYDGKELFSKTDYNTRSWIEHTEVGLEDISEQLKEPLLEMAKRYGYKWTDD